MLTVVVGPYCMKKLIMLIIFFIRFYLIFPTSSVTSLKIEIRCKVCFRQLLLNVWQIVLVYSTVWRGLKADVYYVRLCMARGTQLLSSHTALMYLIKKCTSNGKCLSCVYWCYWWSPQRIQTSDQPRQSLIGSGS